MAAGLVAACGSGGSATVTTPPSGSPSASAASPVPAAAPPSTGAKPTSCGVITSSEASAALGGQPVKGPLHGKATVEGGRACVYYGPQVPAGVSPNVAVGDSVRVVLVVGPKAKKYFDDYRRKVHAEPISGLGDQAYYDGYASLSVLKGNAYVRIAVGEPNNLAPEKMLAQDALPLM
jgi:hypothetical protein